MLESDINSFKFPLYLKSHVSLLKSKLKNFQNEHNYASLKERINIFVFVDRIMCYGFHLT